MTMSGQTILGMDIGGTNVRAGLVDESGQVSCFELVPSALLFSQANETTLQGLSAYIQQYIARFCPSAPPAAVSIGFPSTLNREKTVLLSTPNLPFADQLPVVSLLREQISIPVLVNRDVNMLLLNDMQQHRISRDGITISCYFGTGLGNAIWLDGHFLTGKNGVAGELGHIPVYGCHTRCGCGNIGCMETLAAGRYLTELQQRDFPNTPINALFTYHRSTPQLQNFIEILSLPVATEINIFDPDHVILGGGVLQMPDFPTDLLEHFIRLHARKPFPCDSLHLVYSRAGQDSGVIGAGLYGFTQLPQLHTSTHCKEVFPHDCVSI